MLLLGALERCSKQVQSNCQRRSPDSIPSTGTPGWSQTSRFSDCGQMPRHQQFTLPSRLPVFLDVSPGKRGINKLSGNQLRCFARFESGVFHSSHWRKKTQEEAPGGLWLRSQLYPEQLRCAVYGVEFYCRSDHRSPFSSNRPRIIASHWLSGCGHGMAT